jgi:hypothetical protein
MNDIIQIFDSLIEQYGSIDIANNEFKKLIAEDENIFEEYSEWCHAVGSSEKKGFLDYCEEYKASQDSIWDTLTDFDE